MKTIIIVLTIVYFVLLFSIKAIQYLRRGKNEKKKETEEFRFRRDIIDKMKKKDQRMQMKL
ncbi:hypothetical protein KAU19_06340 [Candidatus Parcubacteria bacterium]|nr:hypothetical protein [Candidatus Parcubacteria bacterium]